MQSTQMLPIFIPTPQMPLWEHAKDSNLPKENQLNMITGIKKWKALICSSPAHLILWYYYLHKGRTISLEVLECFKWDYAPSHKTIISTDSHITASWSSFTKKISNKKISLNIKATAYLITLVLQTTAQPSTLGSLLQLFVSVDDLSWIEWIFVHQPVWNTWTKSTEECY